MLYGSIVALVTPMCSDGSLDFKSLDNLIDWHLEQGTDGLVIAGTTGESAALKDDERLKLVQHVVDKVSGRIPVIAGTGGSCTKDVCELTSRAMDIGVDAALIMTPAYVKPTQKGLLAHYKAISEYSSLPIILYNVPSRTACDLLPETVAELSRVKNIVAIKEATGSINRLMELSELCQDDFLFFSGDDITCKNFMLTGGHGVVSVTANIMPKEMSLLCKYATEHQTKESHNLDEKLSKLHRGLFWESNPIPTKWLLSKLGLISNHLRLPLTPLSDEYTENLYAVYQDASK